MFVDVLMLVIGIALLTGGGQLFVTGSARVAQAFGISPIVVGVIVIGFGTSAPEMVASVLAAAQGRSGVAFGNLVGSNISNIGLVLGAAAMVQPAIVNVTIVRREALISTVAALLFIGLALNGSLDALEGGVLLVVFVAAMGWLLWLALRERQDTAIMAEEVEGLVGTQTGGGAKLREGVRALVGLGLVLARGGTDGAGGGVAGAGRRGGRGVCRPDCRGDRYVAARAGDGDHRRRAAGNRPGRSERPRLERLQPALDRWRGRVDNERSAAGGGGESGLAGAGYRQLGAAALPADGLQAPACGSRACCSGGTPSTSACSVFSYNRAGGPSRGPGGRHRQRKGAGQSRLVAKVRPHDIAAHVRIHLRPGDIGAELRPATRRGCGGVSAPVAGRHRRAQCVAVRA